MPRWENAKCLWCCLKDPPCNYELSGILSSLETRMKTLMAVYEDVMEKVELEEEHKKKRTHEVDDWIQSIGIVGTMGSGPAPLANWPSPKASKELGLEASQLRKARTILCPGTLKGLGPKANQFRNARPILRPRGRLFTQVFPFLIGNSTKGGCLPALHGISIWSPMSRSIHLQETRNAFLAAVISGR